MYPIAWMDKKKGWLQPQLEIIYYLCAIITLGLLS